MLNPLAAIGLGQGSSTYEYQRLFEEAKRARIPYDKEAWLNVFFYLGEQYVEWNPEVNAVRRIERAKGAENAPRPVSNKIKHFVLSEQASVLQSRPEADVLPATQDPSDVSIANVALAYLNWLQDPQVTDFDGVLSQAVIWALSSIEGYIKWCWNPGLDDGKGRGDICVVSPFDIYPDPYAKSFKDCRYVIHTQFMDVEQVYDIYGVELQPSDLERAEPTRVALMREMGMAPVLQGVYVNELWMKPNRRHPNGLYVVWAHNTLLVAPMDFPYDHKHLPFTQIGSVMKPGSLHYTSAVSDLRAPQMELNKFHAQMIQVRQAFSNPKWFWDSSLELEQDPDDSPNQILKGNTMGGQYEPKIIQPTTMPPNDAGAWIRNEMMDIVGLHEVSSGQVPGRVEAAKAIELLQEQDAGRLAELLRTIKSAVSEGFWQQLMLAKQYRQEEQIVNTYSKDGVMEVKRFMAAKLDPAMRIRVTMGTGLGNSRAARIDNAMNLWGQQVIRDPEVLAEILDVPVSTIDPDNAVPLRLSRNENYTIAEGTPLTANSWDNHDIHIREHNNFRCTNEFLMLDPKIKVMFEFHVQQHKQLQVQSLGEQLQIQELAAAVASGQGFQMPAQTPQGTGQPSGQPPQITPAHAPAPAPPKAQPAPNPEAGKSPLDLTSARQSPQGTATYVQRFGNELSNTNQR